MLFTYRGSSILSMAGKAGKTDICLSRPPVFTRLEPDCIYLQMKSIEILKRAYGEFGVGAFNVFNAEQVMGVFEGAATASAPVLVAITPAARRYLYPWVLEGMVRGAAKAYPDVEFAVHLDHGDYMHCLSSIDSEFYSSVMFDASREDFEQNVNLTREIVEKAHPAGVSVEAELGVLGGVEDGLSVSEKKARYTDPAKAVEFVERTGCDSLAVAVGTSHGAYKFKGSGSLEMDILDELREKLPGFPLVLHGASAVPRREVDRINRAGGNLSAKASGVPDEQVREAIRRGVCKVNIATDMRLIWARRHREFFRDNPDGFDPVVPGKGYINDLAEFVAEKCEMLGSSGRARLSEPALD